MIARLLLVAADAGPRAALYPLQEPFGIPLADTGRSDAATDGYWLGLIRESGVRGVVCGTSDTPAGRAIEAGARRAAAAHGVPVAAIEDFPGNYYDVSGGAVALLVVESESAAALTRTKWQSACPPLAVLSPARYDRERRAAAALRTRVREQWHASSTPRAILWAGQPETLDCLRTLAAVLPALKRLGASLLFKAHPRDAGHVVGAYRPLIEASDIAVEDVTALSVADAMALAPRAVITQFSSVAIEAGFHGIPSVSVLLPEAGGARLREKKGYGVPPCCAAGAAVCVTDADALPGALASTLVDESGRENIIRCFDAYFSTGTPTLPALLRVLSPRWVGEISS